VMHMKGTPQTMQQNPTYGDVVAEVAEFFSERLTKLNAFGIGAERVVLDIGIGFGKSLEHNLQLLGALEIFAKWDRPLLLGVSRKSFVGQVTGATEMADRLPGSLACACWGVEHGVNIIRTHDVKATRQAVRMTEAVMDRKKRC
jgi:dihydropteroate synthase